jgi:hypothetical protein
VHHVGYAVSDIEDSEKAFEILGFKTEGVKCNDPERNVDILFMKNHAAMIELIAVADEGKRSDIDAVRKWMQGGTTSPYHTIPYHTIFVSRSKAIWRKRYMNSGKKDL